MAIDKSKILAMTVRDYFDVYNSSLLKGRDLVGVNIDGYVNTNQGDDVIIDRFAEAVPESALIVLQYEVTYGGRSGQEWSGSAYSASGIAMVPLPNRESQ